MPADICYVISQGFPARMILHSGVARELKERGLRLAVIVPYGMAESVEDVAQCHDVQVHEAGPISPAERAQFEYWRRYLSPELKESASLWERHRRNVEKSRWQKSLKLHAGSLLNRAVRSSDRIRRWLEHLAFRKLQRVDVVQLLERIQPRVVASTLPIDILEAAALKSAKSLGIVTVGHILSWDNITSKGYFPVRPDKYVSWGPIMTQEIVEYCGASRDDISECGVAHFDAHVNETGTKGTRDALTRLGLEPDRPYLFFGMLMPWHSPNEIAIVERLAEAVRVGRFQRDVQLVVRPHPQSISGPYAAPKLWRDRLEAITGDAVALDVPRVGSSNMPWSFERNDLISIANLLAGASVCLNSGSTLTLEALIHDCPVVLTIFDGDESLPPNDSIMRVKGYAHLKKLFAFGGTEIVSSFEELVTSIDAYLPDPSRHRSKRQAAARAEMGATDGRSSKRIAEALVEIAGHAPSRAANGALPSPLNEFDKPVVEFKG